MLLGTIENSRKTKYFVREEKINYIGFIMYSIEPKECLKCGKKKENLKLKAEDSPNILKYKRLDLHSENSFIMKL